MSADWKIYKLGQITDWFSGGTPRKNIDKYWNGDIPWISASSMSNNRIFTSDSKITYEGLKSGSKLAYKDDILLLVRGSILHQKIPVGIVMNDVSYNQDVKRIKVKDNLNPWFLLYWFMGNEKILLQKVDFTGIGAGKFDTDFLQNYPISLPSLKEQGIIVNIVKFLDDKIHLNNQINQNLEAIAQAIFKSWFIDFEPVRAKISAKQEGKDPELAAMCAISGKSEAELEQMTNEDLAELQATAALFPDELVETELGEVPKGWKVKPLDEIANYLNGLALQKFRPENEHEFLPIVKIAQLKSGIATIEEKASPNIDPKFIINNGDVIFSWSGSLMVDIWCGGKAALNQHLFKVTSIDYPKWFYCSYTKHHLAEFQRIAQAKAVTMGHIKREHLSQALCIVPSNQVLDIGNNVIGAQMQKQIVLRLENNNLIQVRDTLLPKLLSGELDVSRLASETEYEYSTE